jgi:hypothetical protein
MDVRVLSGTLIVKPPELLSPLMDVPVLSGTLIGLSTFFPIFEVFHAFPNKSLLTLRFQFP